MTFLLGRLVGLLLVVLGITLVTFITLHIFPSDPARLLVGPGATEAQLQQIRADLRLDQPLPVQYMHYVGDLARGNLGRSIQTGQPVSNDVVQRFPATLELALVTMLVLYRERGWFQHPVGRLSPDIAPPPFLTGLYLVDSLVAGNLNAFGSAAVQLVMPVARLVVSRLGVGVKLTRTGLLEVIGSDYVRTARAKGLRERSVRPRRLGACCRQAGQSGVSPYASAVSEFPNSPVRVCFRQVLTRHYRGKERRIRQAEENTEYAHGEETARRRSRRRMPRIPRLGSSRAALPCLRPRRAGPAGDEEDPPTLPWPIRTKGKEWSVRPQAHPYEWGTPEG